MGASETRARGWTAVKWSMPMDGTEKERIAQAIRELEAVRGAIGNAMDLALEASETFTVRSAIEMAQAIAPYKPLWIEEPTLRESARGLGDVAAKSPVPIATGEGLFTRYEFQELLDRKGAAIIQPDVMHAGGITEIRKIANLAETYGAEVAPHQCSGPIAHVASMNAMSVCRNFLVQEWESADDDLYLELTGRQVPRAERTERSPCPRAPAWAFPSISRSSRSAVRTSGRTFRRTCRARASFRPKIPRETNPRR